MNLSAQLYRCHFSDLIMKDLYKPAHTPVVLYHLEVATDTT